MKYFFSPPGVVACRPPEGAAKKVGGLQLGSSGTELVPLEVLVSNTNPLVFKRGDVSVRTGDVVYVPRDVVATKLWAKHVFRVKDVDGLDTSLVMVPLQEVVLVRQFQLEEAASGPS